MGDRLLGVETRAVGLRAWRLRQDYGMGVDSRWCTLESLKSMGRKGGLIIYHGVMLKVELD